MSAPSPGGGRQTESIERETTDGLVEKFHVTGRVVTAGLPGVLNGTVCNQLAIVFRHPSDDG